jgi:hypothetical protein
LSSSPVGLECQENTHSHVWPSKMISPKPRPHELWVQFRLIVMIILVTYYIVSSFSTFMGAN